MTETDETQACARRSWLMAGAAGVVLLVLLLVLSFSFLSALVLGLVLAVVLGVALRLVMCRPGEVAPISGRAGVVAGQAAAARPPAATPQPLAAVAEVADEPNPAADSVIVPRAAAAPSEPEAEQPEPQARPDPVPAPPSVDDAAAEPATRPAALDAPREGGPDDLKRIRGVGPKLEKMLHGMGIYHYAQIADWGPAEVAWADANLQGFRGRVSRDDWAGQAAILAAGGETDFSRRSDDAG